MGLLEIFISIIDLWRPAFCKQEAFNRVKEHSIAALCSLGRGTITSMAIFLGRDHKKPSADYKLYSLCKWKIQQIFDPIFKESIKLFSEGYIIIGADDTKLKKTGKKIPFTSWQRDPMSPPFHVNFTWALRFLQFSVLIPLYKKVEVPCRAVPIRFIEAHALKRPGKKASDEVKNLYKQQQKHYNLSHIFVREIKALREAANQMGSADKKILMVVDGSYCNGTCLSVDIFGVFIIGRCRKDAKLCKQYYGSKRLFYAEEKFTPEDVRKDETIPWKEEAFFYGGQYRKIRYKEVKDVLWPTATKRKMLRLIVIAPIPYVRGGRRNYRDPAYLLTTDIEALVEMLIQAYLDRIQIEYNFRDEKSIIGVGEAQVRNEQSVLRQPALCVAAYSALLLASILAYDDCPHADFGLQPTWRPMPKRNSCRALIGLLRTTLLEKPQKMIKLKLTPTIIAAILSKAA